MAVCAPWVTPLREAQVASNSGNRRESAWTCKAAPTGSCSRNSTGARAGTDLDRIRLPPPGQQSIKENQPGWFWSHPPQGHAPGTTVERLPAEPAMATEGHPIKISGRDPVAPPVPLHRGQAVPGARHVGLVQQRCCPVYASSSKGPGGPCAWTRTPQFQELHHHFSGRALARAAGNRRLSKPGPAHHLVAEGRGPRAGSRVPAECPQLPPCVT